MSKEHAFPDEMLMAFADGELDGPDREAVERAIDEDPDVAARVAMFMETRERVSGAFGKVLSERPPERLFEAVLGAGAIKGASLGRMEAGAAVPLEAPANENRRALAWRHLALAASVAAATAGLAGFLAGTARNDPATALAAAASAPDAIGTLLSSPAEGQASPLAGSASATVTGTYRLRDGRICRTFEVRHQASRTGAEAIGCRQGGGWRLEVALPRALDDGLFRPASGGATIDTFLDAGGAGQALPKADVERAGREGWQ
jgi:anti-sigma factor RsiW